MPFGINTSVANKQTSDAIKVALKTANSKLTNDDLSKITFTGGHLITGSSVKVTAKINDQGTASVDLQITILEQKWTKNGTTGLANAQIYVAPVKIGNTYYLGIYGNGLWTSTDDSTWTKNKTTGLANANILAAPVKIGNTYYLSTDGDGLWTSTNGSKWVKNGTTGLADADIHAAPVKLTNKVYYLGTNNGQGLWTSSNGSTWVKNGTAGLADADILAAPVEINNVYYLSTIGDGLWTNSNMVQHGQKMELPGWLMQFLKKHLWKLVILII